MMDLMAMDGNGNLTAMDRLMVMDGNGRQLTDGWSGAMAMDGAMVTRRQLDGKGQRNGNLTARDGKGQRKGDGNRQAILTQQ